MRLILAFALTIQQPWKLDNKHSHHGHSHDSSAPNPSAAGTNATANALQASVLPVATPFIGANTAHSLATAAAEAPSTIPKAKGTGAAAASLEGHNKVIVVFKKETPASEIEAAVKDVESKGSSFFLFFSFLCMKKN